MTRHAVFPLPDEELRAVRSSAERWRELGRLVTALESLMQVGATIDAHGTHLRAERLQLAVAFEERLTQLGAQVEQAESRLTSELLETELRAKQRKERR